MLKRFRASLGVVPSSPARASWPVVIGFSIGFCAALSAATVAFAATAKQDALALLISAVAADELTRATIAQQIGDATLLAALHQPEDSGMRLAAVRCSPYLSDPDRALLDLAELARGSDPELAPAAALRGLQIAQSLIGRGTGQEIGLDSVSNARRQFVELAEDRSAIAMIRLLAGQSGYLLGVLLQQLGATA